MTALVLDTETTGRVEPKPIEVAWIEVTDPANLTERGRFCQRYNPGKPSELGALATHHILDGELANCPPASTFTLPPVDYLIGHRVDYDWQVIGSPPVKRICTHALATMLWPEADTHSQSALLYLLEHEQARAMLVGAHSALVDVENCLVILGHVIAALGGVESWEALWQRSEAARVPTVMAVGKHKGTPIAELPRDYVAWFLRQPDVDPYLRTALEGAAR